MKAAFFQRSTEQRTENREQRTNPSVALVRGFEKVRPAACSVCNSDSLHKEPFYYDWNSTERRFWRCTDCTHQFVYPFISDAEFEQIFSDDYFEDSGDWACNVFSGSYSDCRKQLEAEAQEVLRMLPIRSGKLLEIGCAGGVFLGEAAKAGFDVTGIEPNEKMAETARENANVDVYNCKIETIPSDDFRSEFDVVVLMDVLEHIPNPKNVIELIDRWAKPTACLFVRGPLSNSKVAYLKESIRRTVWIDKQLPGYPLDANAFTKKSLMTWARSARFTEFQWIKEGPAFANFVACRK